MTLEGNMDNNSMSGDSTQGDEEVGQSDNYFNKMPFS